MYIAVSCTLKLFPKRFFLQPRDALYLFFLSGRTWPYGSRLIETVPTRCKSLPLLEMIEIGPPRIIWITKYLSWARVWTAVDISHLPPYLRSVVLFFVIYTLCRRYFSDISRILIALCLFHPIPIYLCYISPEISATRLSLLTSEVSSRDVPDVALSTFGEPHSDPFFHKHPRLMLF